VRRGCRGGPGHAAKTAGRVALAGRTFSESGGGGLGHPTTQKKLVPLSEQAVKHALWPLTEGWDEERDAVALSVEREPPGLSRRATDRKRVRPDVELAWVARGKLFAAWNAACWTSVQRDDLGSAYGHEDRALRWSKTRDRQTARCKVGDNIHTVVGAQR